MAGLMNSYFYGKAGKGDYTVEQMPTNRRQLFFTTLRVRFSSLMGLNFFHLLFCLPLLLWVFLSASVLTLYDTEAGIMNGGDVLRNAYVSYMEYDNKLTAINNAPAELPKLEAEKADVEDNIAKVKAGKEVLIEEEAVVEGGEKTTRPVTLEELEKQLKEYEAKIEETQAYLAITEEELEALKSEHDVKLTEFTIAKVSVQRSQLNLSLLIMIPLIALAGIGSTGQMYVLRNWARDEHAFLWSDYKDAISKNWKQGLAIGFLNGLSIYICYVAFITYGDMASTTNQFFVIPQMLMVMLLAIWWMMNEVIFAMMVTYDFKIRHLIRNSAIMVIARLPMSVLILLICIAPVLISMLFMQYSILILVLFYGLFGFALTGFVCASYANSCFDRFLNPRIEGAEVNKGLRPAEEDDDEEEELPEVKAKEDRFWERKS